MAEYAEVAGPEVASNVSQQSPSQRANLSVDYRTITKVTSIASMKDDSSRRNVMDFELAGTGDGQPTGAKCTGIIYGYFTRLDIDNDE